MTDPPSAVIRAISMRATFREIRGRGPPVPSSGCSEAAKRNGGSGAEWADDLRAFDDVQVREHVDVGVALDDGLALAILLDSAHPRLGRPVAHEPRHGDVADVGLEDLLGARVVLEPLGLIPRVTAGLELAIE